MLGARKTGANTTDWIKDWGNTYGYDFFDDGNFRDFVEASADGKVAKGFDFSLFPSNGGKVESNIVNESPSYAEYDIMKYSSWKFRGMFNKWTNSDGGTDVKGRQLTITQADEGVYGLVYICEFERSQDADGNWQQLPKNKKALGTFSKDNPLVVTDESILSKLVSRNPLTYLYTISGLTWNYNGGTLKMTVRLGEPDKLELKPEELTFEASAGTQNVTADTDMDDISVEPSDKSWLSATYDKTGKTISVSATENKGESKRNGTITVTGKNGNNTIVKTIKVTQAAGVLKNFFNISRIEFQCSKKESHGRDIGWTTYDADGINYDSRYGEYSASGFTSTREGDYQVITVNYQASNYASGGKDENLSLIIKLDKDFNAEGSFSVTRKTHAGAGAGAGFVASTCNMSMSGTFGPEAVNKTYSFLWYPAFKPKSFSYSLGGFKAYFWETNSIEDFGTFSTSSTDNAEINIVIR